VLVRPGEYLVCPVLSFRGKAITVRSEAGLYRTIVRKCEREDDLTRSPVVTFQDGEGEDSILEGFTIAGEVIDLTGAPYYPWYEAQGGGILFAGGASPTIRDCLIAGNVSGLGGGIACLDGASPRLTDCTIAWNCANGGGGVYVENGSPVFDGCTIRGNVAAPNDIGGSGVLVSGGSPRFSRTKIAGNGITCGSALHLYAGSTVLENCAIFGNSVALDIQGDARFVHCTISGNGYLWGFCHSSRKITLVNSILWANSFAPAGEHGPFNLTGVDPRFVRAGVFALDSSRKTSVIVAGREIQALDPVIEEPDFHLLPDSPAIDAVPKSAQRPSVTPLTDLEGTPRPCRDGLDYGAYEFVARPDQDSDLNGVPDECERTSFHRGDADGNGLLDLYDTSVVVGSLFLGSRLDCLEAADADNDAAVDLSDAVGLLYFFFLGGPPPASPGPVGSPCGRDPDAPGSAGDLGCLTYPGC
jgi:hypothetical protein